MKSSQGKLMSWFSSTKKPQQSLQKEKLQEQEKEKEKEIETEDVYQQRSSLKRLKRLQLSDDEDEGIKMKKRINIQQEFPQQKEIPRTSSVQKAVVIEKSQQKEQKSINKQTPSFGQVQAEIGREEFADFDDKTPKWAYGEGIRDKNGKKVNEEGYDPTTLQIPESAIAKLTPTMKQFWRMKSNNFDKIIFFKLGKFYEIFYEDAIICHKHLELNWMARKMHVGFPEKVLDKYASALVTLGYKVAIVEQMETPAMQAERLQKEKQKGVKQEKTIQREIVEVVTKGTMKDYKNENILVEEKYLMAIRQSGDEIGAVLLECATDLITIVHLEKDKYLEQFKTVIQQYRPVEVLIQNENISQDMHQLLNNSNWTPVISYQANNALQWHHATALTKLEQKREQSQEESTMIAKYKTIPAVIEAIAGLFSYLQQILILDRVLSLSIFTEYSLNDQRMYLLLDSQCLSHLELLSSSLSTPTDPTKGSLYAWLNICKTPMGCRLLKKWLIAPLLQIHHIQNRQHAIQMLQDSRHDRDAFRMAIKGMSDLERSCSQLYALTIRNKRQPIYFEDINLRHMKLIYQITRMLNKAYCHVKTLQTSWEDKGGRVGQLLNELLPDIPSHLSVFSGVVQMTVSKDRKEIYTCHITNRPSILIRKQIEQELEDYLQQQRQRLGDNRISYAHSLQQYQLEVPEHLVEKDKKPKDYEFSSKKAGYQRFLTAFIREKVLQMETQQNLEEEETREYLSDILKTFYSQYRIWSRLSDIIAELDTLSAISVLSFNTNGMSRPQLSQTSSSQLEIEKMSHPVLKRMNEQFVTNDLTMDEQGRVIILTGPNMGGKSTLLRTLAVNVILAQMGCWSSSDRLHMTPVDRIFTRLGASDCLLQGKSTFFLELEETLCCLKYATRHSLCILDELGRGTSTFDGISIAHAVLIHLIRQVKARCFFSTHYHSIITDFLDEQGVAFNTMAYAFQQDNIVHLYKLKKGVTTDSFGIDVAKIAGVPQLILDKGRIMSQNMLDSLQQQKDQVKIQNIMEYLGHS